MRFLTLAAAFAALAGCATPNTVAPANSARGMVSAADPRAAEAGAEMLRQGGTAADAALATLLALNVVEPQSSGIGRRIAEGLAERLKREGFSSIAEAVRTG